jgi:hypothetical protein
MNVKGYIKLTYLIVPHYNYTPLNVHSAQKSPIPNHSKWISLAVPDSDEPDPLFPAAHMRDLLSGLSGA